MTKTTWKPKHLPVSGPEWTRHIGNRVFVPAPSQAVAPLFLVSA